jgi:hypothetical protein
MDQWRGRVAGLLKGGVLLLVLVPLMILDWDIPVLAAVAMCLAGATVVYMVERWERALTSKTARRRAAASYLVRIAFLLVLFVSYMVEEIPFLVAVAFILAAAAVLYLVERWEDPVRARNSWGF